MSKEKKFLKDKVIEVLKFSGYDIEDLKEKTLQDN